MKVNQYLVIDDSEEDILHLSHLLDKFSFFRLVKGVSTVEEAIQIFTVQPIDVIFLDVRLAHQSGLTLLKASVNLPPVIIISAYPEYAIDSYEIGKAADYIVKPYTEERLHIALTRALQFQSNAGGIMAVNAVFLKMGRKVQRFDFPAIDYVEALGIYAKVFIGDQMNLVNARLVTLTKLLPPRLFMRVHKSYIINVNKITSYDRNNIWLGKTKIPIGVSYRSRLEGLLSLFENSDQNPD